MKAKAGPQDRICKNPGIPRVLFVVSEDWYFLSHRIRFAEFLQRNGFEVAVTCADSGRCGEMEAVGIRVLSLDVKRKIVGPLVLLGEFRKLSQVIREYDPDVIHAVALRMILLIWLCRMFNGGFHTINAVAGMGTLFSGQSLSLKLKLVRFFLTGLFPLMLSGRRVDSVFQNADDFNMAIEKKWCRPEHCHLIRGVGISIKQQIDKSIGATNNRRETNSPRKPIVLFVGRLLRDKGVVELLEASEHLNEKEILHELRMVGGLDDANPNCLSQEDVDEWSSRDWIKFVGRSETVMDEMAQSDLVVLPSYREGLPKVLLEAGSMGLPVITCDVAGCREVVVDGENGLLIPPRDSAALAKAMEMLILDSGIRSQMGYSNFKRTKDEFTENVIFNQFLELYRSIVTTNSSQG